MAEQIRQRSYKKNVLAGALALGMGLFAGYYGRDDRLDLFGDLHRRRSDAEIEAERQRATKKLFTEADAFGKYTMEFLSSVSTPKAVHVGTLEGGNGLLGKLDTFVRGDNLATLSHKVGQTCLTDTAYDIERPAWSEQENPHAAPAQLVKFGEYIVVQSSVPDMPPLQFIVDENNAVLAPTDPVTIVMLAAHNCELTPPTG